MTERNVAAGGTRTSGLWALLAGSPLALWLGAGWGQLPPPPTPLPVVAAPLQPGPAPEPSPNEPPKHCVQRLLAPVQAMAGVLPKDEDAPSLATKRPGPGWLQQVEQEFATLATAFAKDGTPASITPYIATIPDPVDSGLGYQFETSLQALRRGLETPVEATSPGLSAPVFFRDRSWLPWDDRAVPDGERRASEDCRLSTPGILLFRGANSERPALAALLLVGETPTTGLRRAAMASALSLFEAIDSTQHAAGEPHSLRVLGPFFSGSAQSLRLALQSWLQEKKRHFDVQVMTGTATGADVPRWLSHASFAPDTQSTLSFGATTVPATVLHCAYLSFLRHRLDVPADASSPQRLLGVATLSESGTEFGATLADDESYRCNYSAASEFHFPFHVSALRDAYEDLDRRGASQRREGPITRATSLEVSLREANVTLDIEGNPSQKTRTAADLALGGVLEYISLRHVQHLAIRATDIGDAIFLARKIRDVAPDVRLAFFGSDVLLLHPAFRREVLGSLVVSAYPFLGLSEFVPEHADASASQSASGSFDGFDSGSAQGLFNAMLAQRSPSAHLSDYSVASRSPLPVWVSTIGRGTLVPLRVSPTPDCSRTLFASLAPEQDVCAPNPENVELGRTARRKFREDNQEPLHLSADTKLPYAWQLLFVALCVGLVLDTHRQNKIARRLDGRTFPKALEGEGIQRFECAIGRTKWRFYRVIRSFLFVLAFSYMGIVFAFNWVARGGIEATPADGSHWSSALPLFLPTLCGSMLLGALYLTCLAARHFWNDYRSFVGCIRKAARGLARAGSSASSRSPAVLPRASAPEARRISLPPMSTGLGDQLTIERVAQDHDNVLNVARESHRQLLILAVLTAALASMFTVFLVGDALVACDWQDHGVSARLTLMALRSPLLTSGVSPAAPAVLCMACVYVWVVGRMARLQLAHSISRISPAEGAPTRLVSTPLRRILHPRHSDQQPVDEGFGDVECLVLDAIWRPITGSYYLAAASLSAFFPLVLFRMLKPFSTLESDWGTWFLASGLALSVFLIGVTLIQLFQYWRALNKLLKRILAHPIGFAFHDIPKFARDSVDHQLSGTPDDALRWSTCALFFCDLMRASGAIARLPLLDRLKAKLEDHSQVLRWSRTAALRGKEVEPDGDDFVPSSSVTPPPRGAEHEQSRRARLEAQLAENVIFAAATVTRMLEEAWRASGVQQPELERATLEVPQERELRASGHAEIAPQRRVAGTRGGRSQHGDELTDLQEHPPAQGVSARAAPPSAFASQLVQSRKPRRPDKTCDALSPAASAYSVEQLVWLRDAQRFVAIVVTLLLHRHVRQFRYFLHVTTGCALLLLLAVASYPFEPYRLLLTFNWVVMASVVGLGFWVFSQLDRNTLMSHIAGSSPDRLTLDSAFLKRFLGWVVVPMLSVAAAQYPELSNLFLDLLAPLTRGLQ